MITTIMAIVPMPITLTFIATITCAPPSFTFSPMRPCPLLLAGRQFGWLWMDPLMGLVATVVILSWSWTLVHSAGAVLLDAAPDASLSRKIAARLEQGGDRVSDLHLWRVGPGHLAAVISMVSDQPNTPGFYKARLAGLPGLSHITVEVERCPGPH
jgi:Co/Zn/Cd efflux system component